MAEHTPGPWRLGEDAQGPCTVMHPTMKGVAIASLQNLFVPVNGYHDDPETSNWPEERNANARLIAAAPELLAAAKEVWELREEIFTTPTGVEPYWGLGAALIKMSKVIAKAEGQ